MLKKLLITKSTSPEEITKYIFTLREQKGKEKETLKLISEALFFGHEFVVNLFFEEHLTHQHRYMIDPTDKKAILDMERPILKASFYINKYGLTNFNSRLFRCMGRVADYRGDYKKATSYYKKAIKFVKSDPEPYRILELEAFLSFSTIMSGQYNKGYKQVKNLYNKFISSPSGIKLKKAKYQVWTIWLSGLVIRTINAFLDKKVNFDRKEIDKWISLIEKELNSKPEDFSYRKQELRDLKVKLKLN